LLARGTHPLAQVFKLTNNLWSQIWSDSLACWNAINPSDLFVVFLVFITLMLMYLLAISWITCWVSEYHCFQSLKQCRHDRCECSCNTTEKKDLKKYSGFERDPWNNAFNPLKVVLDALNLKLHSAYIRLVWVMRTT